MSLSDWRKASVTCPDSFAFLQLRIELGNFLLELIELGLSLAQAWPDSSRLNKSTWSVFIMIAAAIFQSFLWVVLAP